jgi:hypothetical protein
LLNNFPEPRLTNEPDNEPVKLSAPAELPRYAPVRLPEASNWADATPVNEPYNEPAIRTLADAEPVNEPDDEPLLATVPSPLAENENDAEPVAVILFDVEAHLSVPHFVAPQPDVAISCSPLG